MSNQDTIRLKVPHQELDHSSFFDCEEPAVAQWIAELPMANLGQTTRKLYQALSELNQVRMLPAKRMALLEKLRTPIYYVSKCLTKHYLNQPIMLPEQPRKVAELSHTLHSQLAIGFTLVATHVAALGKRAGAKPGNLIAAALHRTITDHTLNIQRHYQLYQPVKEKVWHNLHQFYNLAKQHKVLTKKVDDSEYGSSTVENCYQRALLIGSCKPNQLRQEDFLHLFQPLTDWAELCQLSSAGEDSLFVVDPSGDQAPVYRELFKSPPPAHWLGLNTQKLVHHLKKLRASAIPNTLKVVDNNHQISHDLLGHLIQSWGSMSKRTLMRLETEDSLDLCIGLSATHHFVSGELSFEALVEQRGAKTFTMQNENPFLKVQSQQHRKKDVWDSPYKANVGQVDVAIESVDYHIRNNEANERAQTKDKYHSHTVQIVNASAHGYCLDWPQNAEAPIKTGEIVGVKQSQSHNWSIAVIRWVCHDNNQHAQLGLELISPSAAPYGARIIHKTGAPAEYMRVLVLPELAATQTPITVLTPRVPFRSGQKVMLNQRAKEIQIQLGNKLNENGAFNQFEFRRLGTTPTSNTDENNSTDDFDSLWGNL